MVSEKEGALIVPEVKTIPEAVEKIVSQAERARFISTFHDCGMLIWERGRERAQISCWEI